MSRSARPFLFATIILLSGVLLVDVAHRNAAHAVDSAHATEVAAIDNAAAVAGTASESSADDVNESGDVSNIVQSSDGDGHGESHGDGHADRARAGELHGDEPQPSFLANLVTLVLLVMLQAVLGFDNLLYISLESRRAPADKQKMVRVWGIGLAIFLRIGLLLVLLQVIAMFQSELFPVPEFLNPYVEGHFNGHSLIVLAGGVFILYTAVKEVLHMVRIEDDAHHAEKKPKSVFMVIFWIALMNLVFSFDSILSAMALTHVFWVMAIAIVMGGVLMIVLADTISTFLQRNRMYEVLGLFILFIVGVMLVSEGGHLAHLTFFGNAVTPMTKTTFYFVIGVLVIVDVVQGRYQRKLLALNATDGTPNAH